MTAIMEDDAGTIAALEQVHSELAKTQPGAAGLLRTMIDNLPGKCPFLEVARMNASLARMKTTGDMAHLATVLGTFMETQTRKMSAGEYREFSDTNKATGGTFEDIDVTDARTLPASLRPTASHRMSLGPAKRKLTDAEATAVADRVTGRQPAGKSARSCSMWRRN